MTKKHYIAAARIIRKNYDYSNIEKLLAIQTFVEFFRNDNPNFKEDVFRATCGEND